MRWGSVLLIGAVAALLAACATTPQRPGPPPPHPSRAHAPPPARPTPARAVLNWSQLPGWAEEDHLAALKAVDAACRAGSLSLEEACRVLVRARPRTEAEARAFLESRFQPEALPGEGVLTAYFTPVYPARAAPEAPFTAPVRPKPSGVDSVLFGDPATSPDRATIESWEAEDALAWMKPEDLFFLQIQGSGVLELPDGRRLKAAVAMTNGQPFVAIARPMQKQGLLAPSDLSGETIRGWLAAHRGPEADAVMQLNPRYVFFSLAPDDGRAPAGAAGVPLPEGRALAVDAARHGMGELLWIDAEAPTLTGAFPVYRRLAAALDVGGAIKGDIRADLYLGRGDDAGREAGRVRHTLRLYRLRPVDPR